MLCELARAAIGNQEVTSSNLADPFFVMGCFTDVLIVMQLIRGRWRGIVDADVKVVAAVTGSRCALPFELKLIEREFETMKSLAHPNIVQGSNVAANIISIFFRNDMFDEIHAEA